MCAQCVGCAVQATAGAACPDISVLLPVLNTAVTLVHKEHQTNATDAT